MTNRVTSVIRGRTTTAIWDTFTSQVGRLTIGSADRQLRDRVEQPCWTSIRTPLFRDLRRKTHA